MEYLIHPKGSLYRAPPWEPQVLKFRDRPEVASEVGDVVPGHAQCQLRLTVLSGGMVS